MLRTKNKSVLSLLLALVMLLGVAALVATVSAPKAEAATAGSYKWRVRVNSSNDTGGWDKGDWTVYGKPTNGTGTEASMSTFSQYINFKENGKIVKEGTGNFPTKVTFSYSFGGGITHRKMDAYIFLDVWDGSQWQNVGEVQSYSYEWGTNSGTKTLTVGSGNYAKVHSVCKEEGDNQTLTANIKGGAAVTTTTKAFVRDQYNVVWYEDPVWSIQTDYWKNGETGKVTCTSNSTTSTISIPATHRVSSTKTVTVRATAPGCGNSGKYADFTLTVQPKYKVSFNTTTNAANSTTNTVAYDTVVNTSSSSTSATYMVASGKVATKTDSYGNVWEFNGWSTGTTATSGSKVGETITIDSIEDTIYATYKLDIGYRYHYLNASGETTRDFTTPIYNNETATDDVTGFQAVTSTGKLNGISYTFVGWTPDGTVTDPANVTNNARYSIATKDVTYDASKKVAVRAMYGLFSAKDTGRFYYYNENGTRIYVDKDSSLGYMNLGGAQSTAVITAPAVPVASVTGSDGKTYTFSGWRKDNASVPTSDFAVGATVSKALSKDPYDFYAVYTCPVSLTYNVNQRYADGSDAVTGTVSANSVSQYVVANNAAVASALRSEAEIAINPAGVQLTREGAEAFDGWKAIENGADTELETATYAATGATMNITTDTVLTAVFRDSRKTVTFVKPDGSAIDTRTVRYNYGVNTTDSDFATPTSTISGVGSIPEIDPAVVAEHKDANNHYYFNGWTRNNDQNEFYGNVNDGFTFNRVKANVQFTASYTAQAHKWQQDDKATSAVSCNGEAGEVHAFVDGGYHRYCTVCEYGKNDTAPNFSDNTYVTLAAADVDGVMILNNRPATCTAKGSTGKTVCKFCFKTIKEATDVEPRGVYNEAAKRWEHKLVQVEAPAGANYILKRCTECGHEERYYNADEHTLVFVAKADATCTEEGYTVDHFLCTDEDCGKRFADVEAKTELDATVVIPALGHDFQFALAKPATCTETGYEEGYVCSRCGELQDPEKMTPATGHPEDMISTEEGFAATCTKPGQEDYVICTVCNTVLSGGETIPALGHDMSGIRVDMPTCTEAGKSYRYCQREGCDVDPETEGAQREEVLSANLPALGHDLVLKKGKAATCTEAGTKDCYECRRCGLLYSDEAGENAIDLPGTVDALGHDLTTVSFPPTCTEAGYTLTTCSRCDYSERAEGAEALGHTGGTATCKDKAVCDVCGKPYGDYASHVWDAGALTTEANCSTRAVTTYTCTVCGETKIEKGGYGDHVFVTRSFTSPTCTQQGVAVRECSVCGKTEQTVTEALGHEVSEWHLDGANAVGTCSRCGETVTEKPGNVGLTHVCEKCGLIHEGRTGIFVQDGLYCKIIGFFRSIFKMFSR